MLRQGLGHIMFGSGPQIRFTSADVTRELPCTYREGLGQPRQNQEVSDPLRCPQNHPQKNLQAPDRTNNLSSKQHTGFSESCKLSEAGACPLVGQWFS